MAENISDSEIWMRELIRQMSEENNLPKRNEETVKFYLFVGVRSRSKNQK